MPLRFCKAISVVHIVRASALALLLLITSATHAQERDRKVYIPHGWITLRSVFDSIEAATGLHPYHVNGILDSKKMVQGLGERWPWKKVLRYYLRKEELTWEVVGTTIYIRRESYETRYLRQQMEWLMTPALIVVTDKLGAKLSFVQLSLRSSGELFSTGLDGQASIPIRGAQDTLECIYKDIHAEPEMVRPGDTVYITMREPDPLEQATVTPYTNQKRKDNLGIVSIGNIELSKQPVSNPEAALAGRAAGVLATQTNGIYGAAYDIIVRGRMSITNGHDPLIIIDNVPYAPGPQSVGNIGTGNAAGALNPMSFIDVNDFEEIQILKNADATAIYGSRGANGVIVIKTKHYAAGKPRLSISLTTGISEPTRLPRMMDTRDNLRLRREAFKNDDSIPDAKNAFDLLKLDTTRNTNWPRYFFPGAGKTIKGHVEVQGGDHRLQYYLGGSFIRETNVFDNHPAHELWTIDGSLHHHDPGTKLTTDVNVYASWDRNRQTTSDVSRLISFVPFAPPLRGTDNQPSFVYNGVSFANPLSFTGDLYDAKSHNILLSLNMDYRITDSLFLHVTAGGNEVRASEFSINPSWNKDTTYHPVRSSMHSDNVYRSWIFEPMLEHSWGWKEWRVKSLTGVSVQGVENIVDSWKASGFANDQVLGMPSMAKTFLPNHWSNGYRYKAVFGQVRISNGGRMVNFSGRRDGSSRFTGARQYGNFGAVGLGWELSREGFWKNISICSFAKLGASYGVTGNDGIGLTPYVDNFAPTAGLNMVQTTDISSRQRITTDAGFEKIKKLEYAVDLGFFQNRVLMTATWYRHSSDHQLIPDSLSGAGPDLHLQEVPISLQNTGWEFTLTSTNIRSKGFSWTSSINISRPVSKLKAFPGLDRRFAGLVLGASPSDFKAYQYTGVNPKTGFFSFLNMAGDSAITREDMKATARHDVRCFGGLENTFQMGNWELYVLLEARLQTGISPVAAFYAANPPGTLKSGLYSNQLAVVNDRWQKSGDIAAYQKATMNTKSTSDAGRAIARYLSSTGILVNADFLRLKTFCLSYRWPKLFKIATGRVFIQGSNLLTLTPYKDADPESQAILSVPLLRSIVVGAELRL